MLDTFHREDDACVVTLTPSEAHALGQVFSQVVGLVEHGSPSEDPAVGRLFPDGYADDEEAAQELRRLTEGSLRTTKRDASRVVLDTLPADGGEVRLDEAQAQAWLMALTDARLILASRLDLTEETNLESELDEAVMRDPASPQVFAISVYQYLSFLQETLVESVSA